MVEESTLDQPAGPRQAKKSQLSLLVAPATFISFAMFIALIGLCIFCFDWKRDSMLSHSIKEGLEFDNMKRSNLLMKGEAALSHGYFYTAERLFKHTSDLLEAGVKDGSVGKAEYVLNQAGCKSGLALVKLEAKKIDEAQKLDDEAMGLCKENGDTSSWVYSHVLSAHSELALAQGNVPQAKQFFEQAQAILKKLGIEDEALALERRFQSVEKKYPGK